MDSEESRVLVVGAVALWCFILDDGSGKQVNLIPLGGGGRAALRS